jgi:hypothetical protein
MDTGVVSRRNQVAPCLSLVNGMWTTQLPLMDSQWYSTKPEMRRKVGMGKRLIPLPRTPGPRGWNLMPPSRTRYVSLWLGSVLLFELHWICAIRWSFQLSPMVFFACAEEMVLLCDIQPHTILRKTTTTCLRKYCPPLIFFFYTYYP